VEDPTKINSSSRKKEEGYLRLGASNVIHLGTMPPSVLRGKGRERNMQQQPLLMMMMNENKGRSTQPNIGSKTKIFWALPQTP